MGIGGPNNPFGHPDAMVDRMIGTAFDKVKYVAENLGLIAIVAKALNGLMGTEPIITQRCFAVSGKLDGVGSENRFIIPAYVEPSSILSISARLEIGQGAYCFNDERFFYTSVEDRHLVLILRNDAPIEFANASVRWFVICGA